MDNNLHDENGPHPVQFYRRVHQRQPELDLMDAVLQEALRGLRGKPSASSHYQKRRNGYDYQVIFEASERADVERWMRSNDRSYLFSFERICEALGLNPTTVRQRVLPPRAE